MWNRYVIDAALSDKQGLCFVPLEGDFPDGEYRLVVGMNYISLVPPEGVEVVAVIHEGGQEAAERFCREHADLLDGICEKRRQTPPERNLTP